MGNEKKQKFVEGEKVLCYHGPLLYEAKIHKLKVKDKVTKFLVHYAGWNTKWDEWVADSRVMKHNDESLKKQKELKQQHTYVSYILISFLFLSLSLSLSLSLLQSFLSLSLYICLFFIHIHFTGGK